MIGTSPSLMTTLRQIEVVAPTDSTVLIQGETGTGKELIARAIHDRSRRRTATFVKLNCAAIPTVYCWKANCFGHEKGPLPEPSPPRSAEFEFAHGGTIFLDEIGDIPWESQSKLLRVLQEREFERLGSTRTIRTDVRLIAATNRSLPRSVEAKEFRSNLYYRLNVFPISTPPLRDRAEDIPLLVRHFVQKFSRTMHKDIDHIPAEASRALLRYHWPGNIRELENIIERAVILSRGKTLRVPLDELQRAANLPADSVLSLEDAERAAIAHALKQSKWIVGGPEGAAARLGMKRTTLQGNAQTQHFPAAIAPSHGHGACIWAPASGTSAIPVSSRGLSSINPRRFLRFSTPSQSGTRRNNPCCLLQAFHNGLWTPPWPPAVGTDHHWRTRMEQILIPLVLLAGAGLPVQAGANARLSKSFGSPLVATTVQLGIGTVILFVMTGLSGTLGTVRRLPDMPWWHAMGGLASACYVLSGILLLPRLGAVATMGLIIAGQMAASLFLDVQGLLGITAKPMTGTMVLGGVTVLAGAACIVLGQGPGHIRQLSTQFGSLLLGLLAGGLLPLQGAVNGLLRDDLQAPLAVGMINFLVATLAMILAVGCTAAFIESAFSPGRPGLSTMPWWGWLGGVLGAYYVLIVFMAMPAIGSAITVGLTITGQQVVSVLVDRYGLLGMPQRPATGLRMGGVVLLITGVTFMRLV
ncbi:MAG: DMT family transporter [Nitrospira sp.]